MAEAQWDVETDTRGYTEATATFDWHGDRVQLVWRQYGWEGAIEAAARELVADWPRQHIWFYGATVPEIRFLDRGPWRG